MNGKSRDLSIKDRAKVILDIQKANRDNIIQLKEICKELGINFKDTQNPQIENENVTPENQNNNSQSSKIDLGSFLNLNK